MSKYIINKYKNWINYNDKKIGSLTVLGYTVDKKWECICDCGKIVKVTSSSIGSKGKTRSCGCKNIEKFVKRNTKHNSYLSKEYQSWKAMKQRCLNTNNSRYKSYGGRGIKICDEWKNSFENFYQDMGDKPTEKHSIDRIDVNGDYTPTNCRWADDTTQNRNKISNFKVFYRNEYILLIDLCEELKLEYQKIYNRIYIMKWDTEKAINTPIKSKGLKIKYNNKFFNLHDICRDKSLNYEKTYRRIFKSKWSVEKAIDTI